MTKPIVGSFDTLQDAQHAVERLHARGIPADDISLISNNTQGGAGSTPTGSVPPRAPATMKDDGSGAATGAAVGGVTGGVAGLAAGLMGLAIPGIGPVIAAGAGLSALAGAGAGVLAGGLIGALTDSGVSESDAHSFAESVRRGGTLLIVRTSEANDADVANLLRECGAVDLEARTKDWRAGGWTRHDPSAAPYGSDEIERERARYRRDAGSVSEPTAGADAGGQGGSSTAATSMRGAQPPSQDIHSTSAASGTHDTASTRGFGDWSEHEDAFRRHHAQTYAATGEYDAYAVAYQFGGDQHRHAMFRDKSWEEIEPQVRRDWESRHRGSPWNNFKAAVRYGWETTRDAVERVMPGDSDRDGR